MTAHAPVQLTFDGLPSPAGTPSARSRAASAHRTDALLASLAVHGAWTIPAAMRLGLSRQRIRSRIEAGRWILCAGSAYCDPRQADDIRVRAAAAQLSLDVGTVWGRTAGILHGLPLDDDGAIHMAVPAGRKPAFRIVPHEVCVLDDPVRLGGAWITSRTETILDCIATLPEAEAHGLLAWVLTRELITVDEFCSGAQMRWGRHGAERLRTYAAMVERGALSVAEDRFHDLLHEAGITGWVPNAKVFDRGRIVAVVDVLFPELKLVVEVDGEIAHADAAKDRRRDALLRTLGFTIIRVTWSDLVRTPELVVDALLTRLSPAA